jgi:hypothetical protein
MSANTRRPVGNEQAGGNLLAINGIGDKTARILPKIGISNCAELAQYLAQHTAEELSELLAGRGVHVGPKKIENEDWLGQAREQVGQASAEPAPGQRNAEATEEWEPTSNHPVQHVDRAVFTVDFEREGDDWKVTTYDEREPDPRKAHHEAGLAPSEWANWILMQMGLAPPEAEAGSQPEIEIEILAVQPSEAERSKKLAAEVRFKVSGPQMDKAAARTPFWIYLHTVDVVSKEANVAASQRGELEPEKSLYNVRLEFPIPELGRYELHTLVLLPLRIRTMALYPASTLQVVP